MRARVLFPALACLLAILPASALASDPPKRTIVVDVVGEGTEFDAEAAREGIAQELDAAVVKPRDRRAADAPEKIRIVVSDTEHMLRVSYEGQAGSNERTIDLPPDRTLAERAAVILASNLARDEASQLTADLRRSKATAAPAPRSRSTEDADDDRAAARLGEALAVEAHAARGRNSVSDLLAGVGFGALGAGLAALTINAVKQGNTGTTDDLAGGALSVSGALIIGSVLVRHGDFDDLSLRFAAERAGANGSSSAVIVEDVERMWQWHARNERNRRNALGWVEVVAGSAVTGVSAWALATNAHDGENGAVALRSFGTTFIGLGALGLLGTAAGIVLLATPSPMESAWRAYKGSGAVGASPASAAVTPYLGSVATGGAVFGMSGQF